MREHYLRWSIDEFYELVGLNREHDQVIETYGFFDMIGLEYVLVVESKQRDQDVVA